MVETDSQPGSEAGEMGRRSAWLSGPGPASRRGIWPSLGIGRPLRACASHPGTGRWVPVSSPGHRLLPAWRFHPACPDVCPMVRLASPVSAWVVPVPARPLPVASSVHRPEPTLPHLCAPSLTSLPIFWGSWANNTAMSALHVDPGRPHTGFPSCSVKLKSGF